jgi:ribosome biogenesis GTPase
MHLQQLGWNQHFSAQTFDGIPGRVATANREHFLVWTEQGEYEAQVSGHFRHYATEWPAVGDWVILRHDAELIEHILTRRTKLSRKHAGNQAAEQVLAANIDALFIVSGLDRDYNPRRIERYLVLARESGARPVVLLNKADLAADLGLDLERVVSETAELCPGLPVVAVSALSGDGLATMHASLAAGETAALIGSSGVGKSTILNYLLGTERQRTFAVRENDSRGRHTTTQRQMFLMPGGWLLIDLPGLRELQLWADPETLSHSFADIEELAQQCRFRDCSHQMEPDCAVRTSGLDPARLGNYRKLQRELRYLDRQNDVHAAHKERQRWKALEKSVRKHPKR